MRRHPRPCPKESAQWLLCMSFVLEEGNPLRDFLAWRQSCLKQARAAGTKVAHGPTLALVTVSNPVFVGLALRKVGPASIHGRLGGHAHKHATMLGLLADRLLDLLGKCCALMLFVLPLALRLRNLAWISTSRAWPSTLAAAGIHKKTSAEGEPGVGKMITALSWDSPSFTSSSVSLAAPG
eukprot:m.268128 g.268128  ORF g.268128 m.268128 type:complete len:181 (-) comp11074_c2_seq13:46-588(-)